MDWAAFNWIDYALLALVLLGILGGWRTGFVAATLQVLSLALGLAAAFFAYPYPAAWAQQWGLDLGVWQLPLSFIVCFVLAQLAIGMVTRPLLRAVPARAHAHGFNRLLGVLPGAVNGAINAAIVSLLLLTLPLIDSLSRMARDSQLAARLAEPAEWLEARLTPIFDPAIRRSLQTVTVNPGSQQMVQLPFRVTDARARPDLEARMLELVNAERAAQGLRPLQADPQATEVARAHSRDMFARGYFSHVTPEGTQLNERLRRGQVRFLLAGENLALAQTLQVAHAGLMNSPGHRANILRPQFGRVGIGVLDGGARGLMVTQNFRN